MANPSLLAQEVIKRYGNGFIPTNLESIAFGSKIDVRYVPEIEVGKDYSGSFEFDGEQPVCLVRSTDCYTRRRFTLAHEMGHYFLGHESGLRDNSESFSSNSRDPKEIDANAFAAELLMPKNAVEHFINERPYLTLQDMADIFEVSVPAMTYRLRNLGYQL